MIASETVYVARLRDRRPLRFSKSGNLDIERAYRTHWVSPALSEAKRRQLADRQDHTMLSLSFGPTRELFVRTFLPFLP